MAATPEATVLHGDCLQVLKGLAADSVDAIVTDPPSGISFMNMSWDHHKGGRDAWIAWLTEVMTEAIRVLKPGGHALVWALPRTSHWTAMACEDAGFEIRDRVSHIFATGFPKSLDVGKAIDRAAGAERERNLVATKAGNTATRSAEASDFQSGFRDLAAPAIPEAAQWDGWGTAMKPAVEDWWLCRKPLAEKTVAGNVLAYGTGALNIDATRVSAGSDYLDLQVTQGGKSGGGFDVGSSDGSRHATFAPAAGRWPAHLLLSHADGCVEVGTRKVKGVKSVPQPTLHVEGESGHALGIGVGRNGSRWEIPWVDDDGTETIPAYDCVDGCPVAELDRQSGVSVSPGKVTRGGNRSIETFGLGRWPAHLVLSHSESCVEVGTRTVKGNRGTERDLIAGTTPPWSNYESGFTETVAFGYGETETIPAWDCVDGCPVAELDRQSGVSASPPVGSVARVTANQSIGTFIMPDRVSPNGHGDSGGASRFFPTFHYAPKAPTRERPKVNGVAHPTVKSLDLMKWLIRLITPPGGTVLDPFAGSGATLQAALEEGFSAIGIEMSDEYIELIEQRVNKPLQLTLM